jgi:hypothetical protein
MPDQDQSDFARRRLDVQRKFAPFLESADSTRREKIEIREQMEHELREIAADESRYIDATIFGKARKLDIDLPPFAENDLWDDSARPPFLTPKGRLTLRKAIDEENTRRRDVAAWWWKTVIIPGLAAATGLVGALTGLIAILHRSK